MFSMLYVISAITSFFCRNNLFADAITTFSKLLNSQMISLEPPKINVGSDSIALSTSSSDSAGNKESLVCLGPSVAGKSIDSIRVSFGFAGSFGVLDTVFLSTKTDISGSFDDGRPRFVRGCSGESNKFSSFLSSIRYMSRSREIL